MTVQRSAPWGRGTTTLPQLVATVAFLVLTLVLTPTVEAVSSSAQSQQRTTKARAWTHAGALDDYPEKKLVSDRKDVGVSFSGGGSRSYAATLGYLRGLLDLNLLDDIRYISSVSGGTWAVAVATFRDPTVTGDSLAAFLGEPVPPEKQTLLGARRAPLNSARMYPVRSSILNVVTEELLVLGTPPTDVWVKTVHRVFLRPAGIGFRSLMAWSRDQVARIVAENPHLADTLSFVLPCGGSPKCRMPFPIINTAMLGPIEAAPFGLVTRRYVMMEITPIHVGFPRALNVSYPNTDARVSLGGLVSPVGFGAPTSREWCGLGACARGATDPADGSHVIEVPGVAYPFGLANASAASSWAPGAVVAEEPLLRPLDNMLLAAPYFSPLFGGESRELFLGDGANMENQGFISLLQRRVRRIVAFINTQSPLSPRERWNPYLRPPRPGADIDESFSALFGMRGILPPIGQDFGHAQVFPRWAFPGVVDALQRAQKTGKGAVATLHLVTVANTWWGIRAGFKCAVTFVYLGRAYEWENRIADRRLAEQVAPNRGLQQPGALPTNGTFKDFPHVPVTQFHISASVSNMLADLSWWLVVNNRREFERAVHGSMLDESENGGVGMNDDTSGIDEIREDDGASIAVA